MADYVPPETVIQSHIERIERLERRVQRQEEIIEALQEIIQVEVTEIPIHNWLLNHRVRQSHRDMNHERQGGFN